MDVQFAASLHEEKIYHFWEKEGYLKAPQKGTPYTILMPPPNANASLHAGHGMYTIDDIMIRYKRLKGFSSVWIPGVDHAGFETQFVYEKYLAKQKKSRMDYDRDTLYKNIFQFVHDNSGLISKQFKKLGFLADWSRSVFTLDEHVVHRIFETFKKMHEEGLIYRDTYMVNYCVHCGTTLADLEIVHSERKDPLYYIRYSLVEDEKSYIVVATVRPEPIFVDTHLAVNPKDTKNKKYIGKKVFNPLTHSEMDIIGDDFVDPLFGTGIVKLTPGHDPDDFDIARAQKLPIVEAIDWNGRMRSNGGKYAGMKVRRAREEVVKDLITHHRIDRVDTDYTHTVGCCYKCGRVLEPLILPNWFIKVEKLKKPVIEAVKKNKVRFYPAHYKRQILDWLNIMHDWPISRQIVWGIRIPVWYRVGTDTHDIFVSWIDTAGVLHQGDVCSFLKKGITVKKIRQGLQKISARIDAPYIISFEEPSGNDEEVYLQETDTFDTWFSSGQWTLVTLQKEEYDRRYPTDMMGTLSDILRLWISRMIMFSLYVCDEVPFKNVYLWSMVADSKGMKMSKSRGNVVNPLDMIDKYGADAMRASLVFGTGQGSTVIFSEDKIRGMRNYANKIWNIGRFISLNIKNKILNIKNTNEKLKSKNYHSKLKAQKKHLLSVLEKEFKSVKKQYHAAMGKYQFSYAFGLLYEFSWHRFADHYIEVLKDDVQSGNIEVVTCLYDVYTDILKYLHPFMPFVTEAVWKVLEGEETSLLDQSF